MKMYSWWVSNDSKRHLVERELPEGIDRDSVRLLGEKEDQRLRHMLNRGEIQDYLVEINSERALWRWDK